MYEIIGHHNEEIRRAVNSLATWEMQKYRNDEDKAKILDTYTNRGNALINVLLRGHMPGTVLCKIEFISECEVHDMELARFLLFFIPESIRSIRIWKP